MHGWIAGGATQHLGAHRPRALAAGSWSARCRPASPRRPRAASRAIIGAGQTDRQIGHVDVLKRNGSPARRNRPRVVPAVPPTHRVIQTTRPVGPGHPGQQRQHLRQVPFTAFVVGDLEYAVTEQGQRAAGRHLRTRGCNIAIGADTDGWIALYQAGSAASHRREAGAAPDGVQRWRSSARAPQCHTRCTTW